MPQSHDPSGMFREPSAQTRPPRSARDSRWTDADSDAAVDDEMSARDADLSAFTQADSAPSEDWQEHALDARIVSASQGAYYGVLALWPLFSPQTFNMLVWQSDVWLSRSLGGLLVVVAISLLFTSRGETRGRAADGCVVGVGSALVLLGMNIAALAGPSASKLHMLDAGLELGFLIWWLAAMLGLPNTQPQGHFHDVRTHRAAPRVEDSSSYH